MCMCSCQRYKLKPQYLLTTSFYGTVCPRNFRWFTCETPRDMWGVAPRIAAVIFGEFSIWKLVRTKASLLHKITVPPEANTSSRWTVEARVISSKLIINAVACWKSKTKKKTKKHHTYNSEVMVTKFLSVAKKTLT